MSGVQERSPSRDLISQAVAEQPVQSSPPMRWEVPTIGGLLFLMLIVVGLEKTGVLGLGRQQQIGRARWASWREIQKAKKYAYEQVLSPKISETALWINKPRGLQVVNNQAIVPFDKRSIWIPEVSQSVFVFGATNAGKSYSVLDRLKNSACYLGHSIIDFDPKGNEATPPSCATGGHALKLGYTVSLIDPSGEDTDSINLWDGLSSEIDTDGALILADSLLANMNLGGGSGNSEFFKQAGGMLLAAIILMVKSLPREYQDMATVLKIVSLPNLIKRVIANMDSLPEYTKGIWAQFLSQVDNPETAQSIAGTATIVLGRMFTPELLAVFRGSGTTPIELHGRTMVIFRLNPERIAQKPLMGAAMEMMFRRSVFVKGGRKNPVGFFKDEAPQVKTNGLSEILNISRSLGGYAVLGAQGVAVMERTHDKLEVEALMGATKTIIFGGLKGNRDTAYFSTSLGSRQIEVRGKSKSMGKNSSRTDSENPQTTPLMEPHEVKGLKRGQFIFDSPAVGTERKSIPFRKNVRISKEERKTITDGLEAWTELRRKRKPQPLTDEELREREAIANRLFPEDIDPDTMQLIVGGL